WGVHGIECSESKVEVSLIFRSPRHDHFGAAKTHGYLGAQLPLTVSLTRPTKTLAHDLDLNLCPRFGFAGRGQRSIGLIGLQHGWWRRGRFRILYQLESDVTECTLGDERRGTAG